MVHVESHQRRIAQIREELRRLDAGSDVAYDMAIYDRGASVDRLERSKRQLLDELQALQTGRHPKQAMLRRPPVSPESLDWSYGGYAFGTTWYNKDFEDGYTATYSSTYVGGAPQKTTHGWSLSFEGRGMIAQGKSRTAEGARNQAELAHQRASTVRVR